MWVLTKFRVRQKKEEQIKRGKTRNKIKYISYKNERSRDNNSRKRQ